MKISSTNLQSQTKRDRSWNFERMFTFLHMSHVTCHMSRVTCHMSCVTCIIYFLLLFFGQSGEASRWRVCYQRGLPRLVLKLWQVYLFTCEQKIIYNFRNQIFRKLTFGAISAGDFWCVGPLGWIGWIGSLGGESNQSLGLKGTVYRKPLTNTKYH